MIKKIFFQFVFFNFFLIKEVFAAESGGMPQLNPEFWISQIFWLTLTFGILYVVLSKLILPKISANLELRKSQIQENIEAAEKQRVSSESKLKEYGKILEDAKKEVIKIHIESKNILDKDIKTKKEAIEKEIEKEIVKAQKEISDLKKNSLKDIQQISENIASNIIESISGDKLNGSSIKATVEDISKKNLGKYL